ncbi:MAG TPA: ABC transporter permease [Actinomycetota bacterium]|nr:ABC transporter permease [Actinomycetota bacterium]
MARETGSLHRYLLTRLALAVPMVLILLTLVFTLMRVAPGDPITAALGGRLPAAELQRRRAAAGFDRPVIVQYGEYLWSVAHLDFGTTLIDNRPVLSVIAQNGSATLELTAWAMLVAVGVGVPLGLLAGRFRDTGTDLGFRLFGIVIYAAPVFFLGFLAQLVFGKYLNWLPTSGRASPLIGYELQTHTQLFVIDAIIDRNWSALTDVLRHLVLPAMTLGLVIGGVFIRMVRVNVMQTLKGDYVEAARARGVKERWVLFRHAFKNALVPVITVMGLQFALLLSGAVLTEETFNWPGLGFQLVRYLNNRDYIAVQGIITFAGLVVVLVSLAIDVLTAWVDPRVRY